MAAVAESFLFRLCACSSSELCRSSTGFKPLVLRLWDGSGPGMGSIATWRQPACPWEKGGIETAGNCLQLSGAQWGFVAPRFAPPTHGNGLVALGTVPHFPMVGHSRATSSMGLWSPTSTGCMYGHTGAWHLCCLHPGFFFSLTLLFGCGFFFCVCVVFWCFFFFPKCHIWQPFASVTSCLAVGQGTQARM